MVVVLVVIMMSGAVSLVEGKGVDQRLSLASIVFLEDLRRLLDFPDDSLFLLPQRGDLDAAHANLVVPLGRGVGGHSGLVQKQSRLGPRIGCLRSGTRGRGRGGPPSGRR